jgi:hypothetical protein
VRGWLTPSAFGGCVSRHRNGAELRPRIEG